MIDKNSLSHTFRVAVAFGVDVARNGVAHVGAQRVRVVARLHEDRDALLAVAAHGHEAPVVDEHHVARSELGELAVDLVARETGDRVGQTAGYRRARRAR